MMSFFSQAHVASFQPHNIRVIGYYPSSLDTPGFAEENKNKPAPTKVMRCMHCGFSV